jgi:non-ribosomal peptide synthetase component F
MLLLSVFGLLLYRLTGQDDILVGSPYANRARSEFDELIGFFANTLVLRIQLAGNPTFAALVGEVREMVLGALDHQELPFEYVVSALRPPRQPGMNPLVQINFRADVEPRPMPQFSGAATSEMRLDLGFAAFDLALELQVQGDGVVGQFIYDTALFDRETIERLADAYVELARQVLQFPDRRLLEFTAPAGNLSSAHTTVGEIRGFRVRDPAPAQVGKKR